MVQRESWRKWELIILRINPAWLPDFTMVSPSATTNGSSPTKSSAPPMASPIPGRRMPSLRDKLAGEEKPHRLPSIVHRVQQFPVFAFRKTIQQFRVPIEVIFHGPFVSPGNEQKPCQALVNHFFDDVLDHGLTRNGKHLLRLRFGSRQEPGAHPG